MLPFSTKLSGTRLLKRLVPGFSAVGACTDRLSGIRGVFMAFPAAKALSGASLRQRKSDPFYPQELADRASCAEDLPHSGRGQRTSSRSSPRKQRGQRGKQTYRPLLPHRSIENQMAPLRVDSCCRYQPGQSIHPQSARLWEDLRFAWFRVHLPGHQLIAPIISAPRIRTTAMMMKEVPPYL